MKFPRLRTPAILYAALLIASLVLLASAGDTPVQAPMDDRHPAPEPLTATVATRSSTPTGMHWLVGLAVEETVRNGGRGAAALVARQLGADTVVTSGMHAQPPATNVVNPSSSGAHSADADTAARGRTRRQPTGFNLTAQYAYHCTKVPSTERSRGWWDVFKELAEVLNGELDVPYQLESGTLLNFHRDCEILSNDIDITVPLLWWQTGDNLHRLQGAMFKRHFKLKRAIKKGTFKTTHTYGYEEQYIYDTHGGFSHYRVDIFASIPHPDGYLFGLKTRKGTGECKTRFTKAALGLWNGVRVRVPHPIEHALVSCYGHNWRVPLVQNKSKSKREGGSDWKWDVTPFRLGQCACKEDYRGHCPGRTASNDPALKNAEWLRRCSPDTLPANKTC